MPSRFVALLPCGGVAQLVEQRTHKPRVTRSIRVTATTLYQRLMSRLLEADFFRLRLGCGFHLPTTLVRFPDPPSISTRKQVAVYIHRHLDAAMPHLLLDVLRMRSLLDQER